MFARLADGGEKPVRRIEGQKTLLNRSTHGLAYDNTHDEIYAPAPYTGAIVVFRGGSDGEEAPIRVLQGPLTRLTHPSRMAVDEINKELVVVNEDEILVFRRDANGNVPPIRVLKGPNVQLPHADLASRETAVAVDPVRDLLVVTSLTEYGGRFLLFSRTDQGNVKPKRTIGGGPGAGLRNLAGPITVYPPRGWIIAGDQGDDRRHDNTLLASDQAYVGVWSIDDEGDVPPRWRIGGPKGVFEMPHGVALDPKHKELIVSEKRLNAVLTFYFPEMF